MSFPIISMEEFTQMNKVIEIQVRLGELPEETFVERKEDIKDADEFFIENLNLFISCSCSIVQKVF